MTWMQAETAAEWDSNPPGAVQQTFQVMRLPQSDPVEILTFICRPTRCVPCLAPFPLSGRASCLLGNYQLSGVDDP